MGRRKGSGRGKSTVNSRRTPLENSRTALKDELVTGGATKRGQQQKQASNNDMEAATTVPAATTTATKQYNKTKLQNNQRRNNVASLTATKKQNNSSSNNNNNNNDNSNNNTQAYRKNDVDAGGSNDNSHNTMKTQKQAGGKQGRGAKAAAANSNSNTSSNTATTSIATTTSTLVVKDKEQKTATTATTTTTNGQQNKADIVSKSNTAINSTSSSNTSGSNISSSNNNLNSDNSNSLIVNKQQTQYELNKTKANSSSNISNINNSQAIDNSKMPPATPAMDANDDSWSNSKYLHKKFKRLASTTEIDGNATAADESNSDAASKTRTLSLSSASSSVSSTPPPAPLATAAATTLLPPATATTTITNGYHQLDANNSSSANAQQQPHHHHHHTMPPVHVVNAKDNAKYIHNQFISDYSSNNNNNKNQHSLLENSQQSAAAAVIVDNLGEQTNQNVASNVAVGGSPTAGRHICPYCNLICTKPSVLQKHIRAHTNERPFPCVICKIAFKTKSNYFKHCRSRSHAARSRGLEVPADADDGFSDQEGDADLSNSSSEVISRTDSPMDERCLTSPTPISTMEIHFQQQQQQPLALSHTHSPTTPSPSSLSATKTTYLQHQQSQQLPLGSPAAGTLPPTATTATMPQQQNSPKQQNFDFKPYKPKFHNAALYATSKETTPMTTTLPLTPAAAGKQTIQTVLPASGKVSGHMEQLQSMHAALPTQPPPSPHQQQHRQDQQQPTHHTSLSPSTHMKLNNHLLHQQQHVLAPPPPPPPSAANVANTVGLPTPTPGVYYLGQPPNAAALLHPTLQQQYYDPHAAARAHQQAMAFHQFQMQQHHLQQQYQHQQQQQHLQLKYQQEQQRQQIAPPMPNMTTVIKPHATPAAAAPVAQQHPTPRNASKSNATHIFTNGLTATPSQNSNSSTTATAGLIHGGVAAVASSGGGVHLNKEFLQEHISKLISQNEAIVENKELLLQKKYPKTLNRSRSFNNNNNSNNNNSSNSAANSSTTASNSSNLVTTTSINSESANAKVAHAIAQKKQMQQLQQQQQQQHQSLVQQQHAQYQLQQQLPPQRLDEPTSVQHYPINGLTKQLHGSKQQSAVATAGPQQQCRQPITQSLQLQAQHMLKEALPISLSSNQQPSCNNSPLNLSAKSTKTKEATPPASSPASATSTPTPPTPKKRQTIEHQISASSDTSTNSTASVSSNNAANNAAINAANISKHPQNTSIIKNLLLNARGLAQPTGEGEHAVYICPLCSLEFRTPEDLQTHTGSNCHHGALSSAPITPVASPSHKYFRSVLNPLSLAKLAWSQLKTKPSNGVLNRLSASQASSTCTKTTTTTTTANVTSTSSANSLSALSIENPMRLIDTPLPSPGPLLGKTPLVDSYNNNEQMQRKTESDVIITKMHEHFTGDHLPTSTKRARYEVSTSDGFTLGQPPSGLLITANKKCNNLSGGDIQLITNTSALGEMKKDERIKRFTSSGGSMIPISECSDLDKSPKMIRTPLLSGGSFQEVSPKKDKSDKVERLTIAAPGIAGGLTNVLGLPNSSGPQHFQFPPINSITAFNPLTLPPLDKIIPYVPGIPGPNTPHTPLLPPPPQQLQLPLVAPRNVSPGRKSAPQLSGEANLKEMKTLSPFGGVQNVPSEFNRVPPSPALRNVRSWPANANLSSGASIITKPTTLEPSKKSFNFQRIADNLSPRKGNCLSSGSSNVIIKSSPPEQERRHFNFEVMSKEHELNIQTAAAGRCSNNAENTSLMHLHLDTSAAATSTEASSITTIATTAATISSDLEAKKSKFLRPTSLPLKPGTFTPKRHHGITPTANTLPLISPETPRPSKSCVQLYLNGHAYTYLGLKSSTKMFYCTVNCPQPSYVAGMHKLSMYSVWQVCAENNPHPLGLKPKEVMSLYDSRQKNFEITMAETHKMPYRLVSSQQTVMTPFADSAGQYYHHQIKQIALNSDSVGENGIQIKRELSELVLPRKDTASTQSLASSSAASSTTGSQLVGGYESHEDYTYIRGRGRGRYVCSECGIRCKKPSMLKKHIRTHTDVRPYTCKHCNFSFKTKGNLTKHMQSKTHYKKCIELGINPGPMPADGEFFETDMDCDQQSTTSAGGRTSSIPDGESDSDDFSENESESDDTDESKSRLQEHEAARCLLSLSMTPPIGQSVSPQLKTEGNTSYATQNFNMEQTSAVVFTTAAAQSSSPVPAASNTSTHPSQIKRVVSFTQPKPPFDYQKQEQYYSNPEESKPKRNANAAATSFESAPIDLTKPRATPSAPAVIVTKDYHVSSGTTPKLTTAAALDMGSIPGPLQTKAQIRDVIFGKSSNESGFLKTVISVSDKVRSAAAEAENAKNMHENVLLGNYLTEQALQRHKIKQSQMNRNIFPTLGEIECLPSPGQLANTTTTASMASVTSNQSQCTTTTTSTTSSSIVCVSSSVIMPLKAAQQAQNEETAVAAVKPLELKEQKHRTTDAALTVEATLPHNKIKQDDIEGTLSASDSESGAPVTTKQPPTKIQSNSTTAEPYNANLPAAVHQPGTTDFSGVLLATQPRTVTVGENGFKKNNANEIQPAFPRSLPVAAEVVGKPTCSVCNKSFQKQSQLTLHMNIHYLERKFKCEPCGVPFRTLGHLQKHERSEQHKSKVALNSTFGKVSPLNPRPFECTDCVIAFRIHGHLAKHLRSKGHVQKLECLLKLPIGTYAEIERAGINLGVIDTSTYENSLISLKKLAEDLMQSGDPNRSNNYTLQSSGMNANDNNSNTGICSQDSASEDDGFSAAASAAASAIASLENDSPNDTPRRKNSTSEDDSIGFTGINHISGNLKRRLPNSFSQGEDSDNPMAEIADKKRVRKTENSALATTAVGPAAATVASTNSNSAAN